MLTERRQNRGRRLAHLDPWTPMLLATLRKIQVGTITLTLPDGAVHRIAGPRPGPEAELHLGTPAAARSLLLRGDIGFAESYMAGDWSTPDLEKVLEIGARNVRVLEESIRGQWWFRLAQRLLHLRRANTRKGARWNIEYHYDLGNAFYDKWLDPSMTYSSAVFADPDQPLTEAQRNKYRLIAEQLDLRPGAHVLEIGSGWGGFACYLASAHDCRVTGITLSPSQLDEATRRAAAQGLSDRVDFRLEDYRDVTGQFDAIASIEMFEAVGEENWPKFFRTVHDRLKPGGRAALQIITIDNQLFERYRRHTDFIQRYVFPGGMLPSPEVLRRQVDKAGLALTRSASYGLHYAKTLRSWTQRFKAAWHDIARLGFDDRFRRLWEFYLAYCEAGFRSSNIDVTQIRLVRA